jgi:hypothetical protein
MCAAPPGCAGDWESRVLVLHGDEVDALFERPVTFR